MAFSFNREFITLPFVNEYAEKSEKPTRKKLKKAREKGEFAYSPRFASALSLCFFSVFFTTLFYWGFSKIEKSFKQFFLLLSLANQKEIFLEIQKLLTPIAYSTILLILLITLITFVAHGWQSGFLFTWQKEQSTPKKRRGISFLSILLTSLFLSLAFYLILRSYSPHLFPIMKSADQQFFFLRKELSLFVIKLSTILVFATFFDYLLQRYFFYKEMHMTRQEVKDELKEEQISKKH